MKATINDLVLNADSEKIIKDHNAQDAEVFTSEEEGDQAIADYLEDVSLPTKTHSVGRLQNPNGECIGSLYESYIDSGSTDYFYTILIF